MKIINSFIADEVTLNPREIHCCSFIKKYDGDLYIYILKGMTRYSIEEIKSYLDVLNGSHLYNEFIDIYNGEYPNEYKDKFDAIIRINGNDVINGSHKLAIHTAIRYLWSWYFNDDEKDKSIVGKILEFRNKYNSFTDYDCLYLSHIIKTERWKPYFGLLSDSIGDNIINYITRVNQKNLPLQITKATTVWNIINDYSVEINITKSTLLDKLLQNEDYESLFEEINNK